MRKVLHAVTTCKQMEATCTANTKHSEGLSERHSAKVSHAVTTCKQMEATCTANTKHSEGVSEGHYVKGSRYSDHL